LDNVFLFWVSNKIIMAVKEKTVDVRMQIASYLQDRGIKRSWLAKKINRSTTLIAFILDGKNSLTDENLKNINEALGTDFKRA